VKVTEKRDWRLPASWAGPFLTPLFLSLFMSGLVSMIATVQAIGISEEFIGTWSRAWVASWIVAFPALMVVVPFVRRLVAIISRPE
jgi:hypothetical protein